MLREESIRLLVDLGLTPPQARVYLALAYLGDATANEAYKISKVARQDIYRILTELQRLSLVEKTLARPSKFTSVQMDEGVSILLAAQRKRVLALRAKAKEILKTSPTARQSPPLEETRYVIIPGGRPHLNKFRESLKNSRINVNAIVMLEGLLEGLTSKPEDFQKALDRGVKIRYITTIPKNHQHSAKIFTSFKGDFQVRYLPTTPPVVGAVIDQKEMFVNVTPTARITIAPTLWSNNPSLLAMAQDYFELLWVTALEEIPEEH